MSGRHRAVARLDGARDQSGATPSMAGQFPWPVLALCVAVFLVAFVVGTAAQLDDVSGHLRPIGVPR